MPAQKRINREQIIKCAIDVIEQLGYEHLSVRNIASFIKASTQPIYSEFENINALKNELIIYINETYLNKNWKSYKEYGLNFLSFAKNHKELFKFIFLRQRQGFHQLEDINYQKTLQLLKTNLDLSLEEAEMLHKKMQTYTYALGVMIATEHVKFEKQDIENELSEVFTILLRYYKKITSEDELHYWQKCARNLKY